MRDPGAAEAYDAFFTASWSRLQAQAYVLTGSQEQAQDLTQEAMLRAWTHWPRIAGYDSPEQWTRRVLHNLCIQSWRRSQVRRVTGSRETPTAPEMAEDHVLLAEAMRTLPGAQARALLLHDGLGLTVAETAQELDVPEGTVKSWLSRSRKIVAANLTRQFETTHGGGES
ncbi:MAG TPA: sigma-70 family RNA polymerase sigma factor [Acidimicrobiales bacterium]|nr:sigma-70 family RNA polymerase sigma factor [Acidimicrobiales bacterium]